MRFFGLFFICMFLGTSSMAFAEEKAEHIEAWQKLGLSLEQATQTPANIVNSHKKPEHTLIIMNPVFTENLDDVAMSPDKTRFYDSKNLGITAYDAPTGRFLWNNSDYEYSQLVATNKGVIANYVDTEMLRYAADNYYPGGIVFFDALNKRTSHIEAFELTSYMSEDETLIGVERARGYEIGILNTDTFEITTLHGGKDALPALRYYDSYFETLNSLLSSSGLRSKDDSSASAKDYVGYTLPHVPQYPLLRINTMTMSAQKCYAFAGDSPFIFTLDSVSGQVNTHELESVEKVTHLTYSSDGTSLFAIDNKGNIHVYAKGKWQRYNTETNKQIDHIAIDDQGDKIWLAEGSMLHFISLAENSISSVDLGSFIIELNVSQQTKQAIAVIYDDTNFADMFLDSIETNSKTLKFYESEELSATIMFVPRLGEKLVFYFDGDLLAYKNSHPYTRIDDGTKIDILYEQEINSQTQKSITKKIHVTENVEFYTMEVVYRIHTLKKLSDTIFAKLYYYEHDVRPSLSVYHSLPTEQRSFSHDALFEVNFQDPDWAGEFNDVIFNGKGQFVSLNSEHKITLWDFTNKKAVPLLSYYFFADGNYLVTNQKGNFYSPNEEPLNAFHWVDNNSLDKPIQFKDLADRYRQHSITDFSK